MAHRPNCRPPTPRSGATAASKSSTSAPVRAAAAQPRAHRSAGSRPDRSSISSTCSPTTALTCSPTSTRSSRRRRTCSVPAGGIVDRAADRRHPRRPGRRRDGVPAARDRRRSRQRGHGRRALRLRQPAVRRSCCRCCRSRAGEAARVQYLGINELVDRGLADRPSAGGRRARLDDAARHRGARRRLRPGAHRGPARRPAAARPARSRCTSPAATRCTTSAPSRTTPPRTPPATCCSRARCRTRSKSVYTGLIRIREDAKGTNAFQTNRNLTLSEGAWAESVPNLEIETNDVKCSHASTVGPIDEEQRFYLESRGVPPEVAERLVVLGLLRRGARPAARRRSRRRSAPPTSPPSSTSGNAA